MRRALGWKETRLVEFREGAKDQRDALLPGRVVLGGHVEEEGGSSSTIEEVDRLSGGSTSVGRGELSGEVGDEVNLRTTRSAGSNPTRRTGTYVGSVEGTVGVEDSRNGDANIRLRVVACVASGQLRHLIGLDQSRRTDNSGVDKEGEESHLVGSRVVHEEGSTAKGGR